MTTFLLSFHNLGAPAKKRSLGVAIFDMDETKGHKSATEIVRRAWDLGINPGGTCFFYEITFVPDQYKNQLITDEALLISLGLADKLLPPSKVIKCSCCGKPTHASRSV